MPSSIVAAGATFLASEFLAGYIGSKLLVSVLSGFAGALVGSLFSSSREDDRPANFESSAQNRLVSVRQPITHWQWIYGQARVGGAITFIEQATEGQLLLVITLAGHEVEEIGDIWFDDELVALDGDGLPTGRFAGFVQIKKSLGGEAAGVQPFPDLYAYTAGKWTSEHRQTGRAKIFVRLVWSVDLFPNGIPNITAVVKGRKVYDPRSGLTVWSANAALCVADFITNEAIGLGAVYADEIDEDALIAAANVCDETVGLDAGGTEARYTLNGAITASTSTREILGRMNTAHGGTVRFLGGRWGVYPAAYATPTVTLTADDMRAGLHVMPRVSRRDLFNGVKGIYVSPGNSWQPSDFPAVTNATYLTEDQGERIWQEIDLPFTTSAATAQRIAKINLEKIRQQITVEWAGTLKCYQLQPGDTCLVTLSRYGWSAKVFEVIASTLTHEETDDGAVLGCDLVLRETSSTVYDWAAGEETAVDPAPDSNLPDSFTVAAPVNVTAASGNDELIVAADGTVISRIRVAWDESENAFVTEGGRVFLQSKPAAESAWQDAAPIDGSATGAYLGPVEDGTAYDIRVRFANALGVRSSWTQIAHTVLGKSAPPSDVEVFTIAGSVVSWTPVEDVDVVGYRLKYNPGVASSWGDAIALHAGLVTESPFDLVVVPSGQVTMLLKAVDGSGNESQNPALIVTDLGDPAVANVVETFDLDADGYPGTITNGTRSGGDVVADSTTLMWKAVAAANWWADDSATLLWSVSTYAQMTYEDRVTITEALAGSVMTIETTVTGSPWALEYRENSAALWWSADASTLRWGTDSGALMWVTPDWLTWPGSLLVGNTLIDLRITTGQGTTQGVISTLTVTVDAPDVVEDLNDVVIGGAGTRLVLTKDFSVVKTIQITVQNDGGSAITARIEDKNVALGPLVQTLDAAGSATSGLVDARVQGY